MPRGVCAGSVGIKSGGSSSSSLPLMYPLLWRRRRGALITFRSPQSAPCTLLPLLLLLPLQTTWQRGCGAGRVKERGARGACSMQRSTANAALAQGARGGLLSPPRSIGTARRWTPRVRISALPSAVQRIPMLP
jgi:hypothetical protein